MPGWRFERRIVYPPTAIGHKRFIANTQLEDSLVPSRVTQARNAKIDGGAKNTMRSVAEHPHYKLLPSPYRTTPSNRATEDASAGMVLANVSTANQKNGVPFPPRFEETFSASLVTRTLSQNPIPIHRNYRLTDSDVPQNWGSERPPDGSTHQEKVGTADK